ncbi:ImmA/IrrE family metallo-endopeptidase [Paenibacillus bouchesdurhonensis]|uniref:ImmA/IrrE family metallo-endopeptidase n=1 Tax=Paenibacillus bouchesdurhonensis TaxID=1870990 RepID=UPI000DA6158B|nr:ImmA/IrrE family metallo-endopeptidase [Paenibacillus bouchesdurhonensis]
MEILLSKRLIKAHGTNNPARIASELKLVVLYEDLGDNIWGYYTCIKRIPVIHVNNRLKGFAAIFALAHELAHHFLHQGINTPFLRRNTLFSVDRIEREANRFALHLLTGDTEPEQEETKCHFLKRCGIPEEFHVFY